MREIIKLGNRSSISVWFIAVSALVIAELALPRAATADEKGGATAAVSSVDAVREAISEWLRVAVPPANVLFGTQLRYNEWGQLVGKTETGRFIQAQQPPAAMTGNTQSSHSYVWQLRSKLDSVEHCTLEEFVTRRLAEVATTSCRGRYRRTIPNLTGLSALAVENSLSSLGLKLQILSGTIAPTAQLVSKAQRQIPRPHSPFEPGDSVTVWLFADRNTVAQVPQVD